MNDVNGQKIEITIDKRKLQNELFSGVRLINTIDLTIPTAIFYIEVRTEDFGKLLEQASVIKIKYKNGDNNTFKAEYLIQNIEMDVGGNNYICSISCILNIPDYFQGRKQESFPKKSTHEVFKALTSITPEIKYEDKDDKQTWIRYNITEKEFAEYMYKHIFVKDDLVLGAFTYDKKLRLRKVSDILKDEITIGNTGKNKIQIDNYSFSTNFDVMNYKLSPTRQMQFFDVVNHKILIKTLANKSFISGKKYNKLLDYKPFRVLIDCKNTYDDYLFTYKKNMIQRNSLHNYKVEVVLGFRENVSADQLDVLNGVKFNFREISTNKIDKTINGKYIVVRKVINIDASGATQQFTLARDYYNKVV